MNELRESKDRGTDDRLVPTVSKAFITNLHLRNNEGDFSVTGPLHGVRLACI